MRIDELNFPKDITNAGDILRKAGYEQIGHPASYGLVFHKAGEPSVLKLYANEDHAFTLFVDFCRRQKNIHFPRFSRTSVSIRGTAYRAVKTELLEEGDPVMLKRVGQYASGIIFSGWPTKPNAPHMPEFIETFPQSAASYLPWLKANAGLVEAFALLKAEFAGVRGIRFDLHDENMMMRGDTIVISDPIAP